MARVKVIDPKTGKAIMVPPHQAKMMRQEQSKMALNKARREAYENSIILPTDTDVASVFNHIDIFFADLRSGYVDEVQGRAVMTIGENELVEVSPALGGWIDLWWQVGLKTGKELDLEPLRKIAARLGHGMMLTSEMVESGYAVINQCRELYRTLDIRVVRDVVTVQLARCELDRIEREKKRAEAMQ